MKSEDKTCFCVLAMAISWLLASGHCDAQYRTYYQRPTTYYQQPTYQQPTVNRLDRKLDGSPNYNIGRSAEPPSSEAEKLFMTLVTSDNWQNNARERQVVSWLNNDPRMAKLRGATRFNWYVASNPLYRDRLRYKLGEALPIVAIQRPDGEAILNVTALSMPHSSGELADLADDAVNARYAAPSFAGQRVGGQAVADCPNCPDETQPPQTNPDEGQVQPIPEVIPKKPFSMAPLYALGVFVAVGFVGLVVAVCLTVGSRTPASNSNQIF